jgi:hypothetical protein
VRGVSATSKSSWSNVSAFKTEEKPAAAPSASPPVGTPSIGKGDLKPAPEEKQVQIVEVIPVFVYYLMGGAFVVIVLLIIALLFFISRNY